MTYRAVIFDMDGLLLDSETLCMQCFLHAGELCGFPIDPEVYKRCIGTTSEGTRKILIDGHGPNFPFDEIHAVWMAHYDDATSRPIPLMPGVSALLTAIDAAGIPMGVATSTRTALARRKLHNAGILPHFNFVVGGDQVSKGKPDPEIYHAALKQHDVVAQDCIAFEDSDNGVRAAHAAGIRVIQVPDIVSPSPALKALGHTIVASLEDIEWVTLAAFCHGLDDL